MRSVEDQTTSARIRDAAIEQFGQHGFGVSVRTIATAAGVSPGLVIHHFGSKDGLHRACDEYIAGVILEAKSEAITSTDPMTWLAQMAEIESYAPLMAYLVQSMQSGGELAQSFWRQMIDNVEQYLQEGVEAGTITPSTDPRARARFLALAASGGFLLYLRMHPDPTDLRRVLREYGEDMVLPAMELYTHPLMTDSTMYDAFMEVREQGRPLTAPTNGAHDEDRSTS